MSAAGAIEAGASFIRFFADLSELHAGIKNAAKEATSVGKMIADNFSRNVSTGMENAADSASSFGSAAAASSSTAAAGLQKVTVEAQSASGAVANVGRQFSIAGAASNAITAAGTGIRGVMSSAWSAVGGLGGIAKTAWAASWGLRAVSIAGRLMGKDVSGLEPWIKNLNRFSWAAWGVNLALKAVSASAAGLRGLASLPGRAIGALGRFGRFGGAATTAMTVADSAQAEQGNTGKSIAGGALAGLMMGGVVGAGLGAAAVGLGLTIKTALSRGAMEGARDSKDFLTQLGVAMIDAGNFIKGVWTQVYDKFKSVFASMATEGPSVFERIKDAVFPIVDAVTNVWLPNMFSAIDSIAGAFSSRTQGMGRTWGEFIGETVAGVADFIANFDLYFQYAQQYWVNWTGNRILQFQDMITNFGTMLEWFGKNWQSVLQDIGTLYVTYLTNMVTNFQNAFTAVIDFAKGKGFKFEAVNPFEGWESSIKEWPKLIATALSESSPEMDAILGRITDRQRAMEGRRGQGGNIEAAATAVQDEAKRARDTRFGAVSSQSQDAYSALSRAMNATGANKEEVGLLKQAVKELKTVAKNTGKATDKGAMPGWKMQP